MKPLQKAGGIAAIVKAGSDVGLFAFLLVLVPALGLKLEDFQDPAKGMAAVAAHPVLSYAYGAIALAFFATMLILSLALYDRLRGAAPALVACATAAGLISATLYLMSAMLEFIVTPQLIHAYGQNPGQAVPGWIVAGAVEDSALFAALLAFGVFLLLNSWAALPSGALPRPLAYYGIGFGAVAVVLAILNPLVPPLGFLPPALGIVWGAWLGVVLLKVEPVVARSMRAASPAAV